MFIAELNSCALLHGCTCQNNSFCCLLLLLLLLLLLVCK
jgi:hypothetical protein